MYNVNWEAKPINLFTSNRTSQRIRYAVGEVVSYRKEDIDIVHNKFYTNFSLQKYLSNHKDTRFAYVIQYRGSEIGRMTWANESITKRVHLLNSRYHYNTVDLTIREAYENMMRVDWMLGETYEPEEYLMENYEILKEVFFGGADALRW